MKADTTLPMMNTANEETICELPGENGSVTILLDKKEEARRLIFRPEDGTPGFEVKSHTVSEEEAGKGMFSDHGSGETGFIITTTGSYAESKFVTVEELRLIVHSEDIEELSMGELDDIVGGSWKGIWRSIKSLASFVAGFIPVFGTIHTIASTVSTMANVSRPVEERGRDMMNGMLPFLGDAVFKKKPWQG